MSNFLNLALPDFLATLFGGLLLTLIFFVLREKVFPIPEISGRWFVNQKTVSSSYKTYEGMSLCYVAMLWREGSVIHGTAEKVSERSKNGIINYVGKHRTRAVVSGCVEKRYLGRDRIFLHMVEDGHGRESTHFYDITPRGKGLMFGRFSSMVADQDGSAEWSRLKPEL